MKPTKLKPALLNGQVTVSLIHRDTSRHRVLITGSEQGLCSLAKLLRWLAHGDAQENTLPEKHPDTIAHST
jgi:hypothetical protein